MPDETRNRPTGRAVWLGLNALILSAVPLALGEAVAQTPTAENEAIVVTARRRAESLQDTPVAVTVLSAAALDRQLITSTTALDQAAPNLQFTTYGTLTGNNSAAQVFIRGIGQTDATPAVDPGVGIYIDDVYMGRAVGGAMEFRDIANVQILRGPQGTLFGRNTIGGAVLLTTQQPGDELGGTIRLGFGDDSLREVFAAVDVPMGETLAARVSFGARRRDGYVTRVFDGLDLGDENTYTGQGTLRWAPTEALTLTLRGDYTKEDENGSPFVFLEMNERQTFPAVASVRAGCPGATFPPPFVPATDDPRCANDAQALGPFTNGGTAPAFSTLENGGVSLVAEWRASDMLSFKSITADRHLEWSGARDADNTPLLVLHTQYASASDQFSQEVQAVIDTGRLDGVIGAYYFEEDTFDRVIVPISNPGTSYDTQRVNLDVEAWAAFTQWTLSITDALQVSAGVRYTEETKGIQGILFNVGPATAPEPAIPTALCPFNGAPPTQTRCLFLTTNRFERQFTSTIGSASIQYRWSPAFMTYFSWSQGFKSGGFNQRYNATPPGNAPIAFGAENAESFELGFKSNPTDSLRLNGAIFTTQYDDIQLTYRLGVVPLLFNAGVATIDGGELELSFSPTEELQIDASLGYLSDGFDEITAPAPIGGVAPTATATLSSELPFTPDWQGNIGVSYSFRVNDAFSITPRVNVSYTDAQFFDAGNSLNIAQRDAVTLVNGAIAFEGERFRIIVSGENLTDEFYPVAGTSSVTTASGYAEIIYARPRNYWLTFAADF